MLNNIHSYAQVEAYLAASLSAQSHKRGHLPRALISLDLMEVATEQNRGGSDATNHHQRQQ